MIHGVINTHYFSNFPTELWSLIDFRIMFMLNILDLIKSGRYIDIFDAKTCATMAGYHVVLAMLLFNYPALQQLTQCASFSKHGPFLFSVKYDFQWKVS